MATRVIAVVMATTGLCFIASHWTEYVYIAEVLSETMRVAGLWVALLAGLLMFVPILKVGVAAIMWRIGRGVWYAAFTVLAVDFITLVVVSIRFAIVSASTPDISKSIPSGSVVVQVQSMWPIYTVSVLSALCLFLLTRKATRIRYFGDMGIT